MSDTLIVIVLRNNLALSKLAIKSALSQQPPCDILCVDNASSDGTAAYIAIKNVATISFQKQVSLSACWNAALKAAWRNGYKACMLLNNDCEIREDCISLIENYNLNWPDKEVVTCVSVDTRERMGISGDRNLAALTATERPHPDFSALYIRKSVTDRGLWFNEECFPAYVEDSFAHVAMHRAGVRAVCVDLPFLHHGASTLKQASEREAIIIRKGADCNRERFRQKYGCLPGTPEYEKLFSEDQFGIDRRRVTAASSPQAPA